MRLQSVRSMIAGMSNVTINLTIDRHRSGNTRIHGKVGEQFHDVNVWKGPEVGDAYVEGRQDGRPTTLRINSAFSENGHAVFGRVAGVEMKGNWAQESAQGDVKLSLNKATLTIDQNPDTGVTESVGTRIQSTSERSVDAETLSLKSDGRRLTFSVDRQEDGDIEIRGKSGDGPFRVRMDRRGQDGDLYLTGNIPENLALLPVMWELYGDDSLEPPQKPLSMGAAATLSAFYANQL